MGSLSAALDVEPIPPPPKTQALNSKTFRPPPLDGSLSIPEMYNWHMVNTPNHPLFEYADENGKVRTILWPEAARAVHRTARMIRQLMGCPPEECPVTSDSTPIIAIVAGSDTITYFTLSVAIQYAGYAPFLVSPRNSPDAIAYLIAKVGAIHVLAGREPIFDELIKTTFVILKEKFPNAQEPGLSLVPIFEDIYTPRDGESDFLAYKRPPPDAFQVILHSSGSTAMPKPVPWTRRRLNQLALIPFFGEQDLTGKRLGCHSMPMYHGMGMMQTTWAAASGLIITAFEPKAPAIAPTPDLVMKGAVESKSDIVFCVPSFVEAWARNPEYVKTLANGINILYGGGPLNKEAGNFMTSKGVDIFILYGCSEGGIIGPIIPKPMGMDWDYFRIAGHMKPHFISDGNGCAELVIVSNEYVTPCILNTVIDGVEAYATSDLLAPHPTRPKYWRVFGRADDQIMHNTGEKTNPGPLENILNQDPHVLSSVMFGRGRFQTGVIIDPRPQFKFDPADKGKLAEFRNNIWPTVERMNAFAPQHSRLFKEMILVPSPSKPFTYTAKSTVRRQAVINDYELEIDELFDAINETAQTDINPPNEWTDTETLVFVRKVVGSVLKKELKDSDDIFQFGCDSLQATWIRNSLRHALRTSARIETRTIPNAFVYQHPTISSLVAYISWLANGSNAANSDLAVIDEMKAMAEKYTSNFPQHTPSSSITTRAYGDVVLLTGTTGALGANILAILARSPEVSRVYAFNRKAVDGTPLRQRQVTALTDRGLDAEILNKDNVVIIEGDLSEVGLGISDELHQEIKASVTHIIHNAWRVDFNLHLKSFEVNVRGLRHLIDLALSSPLPSPPRLSFTSTIGVFRNIDVDSPLKEIPILPDVAIGSGYSESKWVSGQILQVAASKTALKPVIIRVGQITGGVNGAWNVTEWVPSLIKSGVAIGALPDCEGAISWIPIDYAAGAVVDFRNATSEIVHLVHPKPVSWSNIFTALSKVLDVPLVPYTEWLDKLEHSGAGHETNAAAEVEILRRNPALRILQFFQSLREYGTNPEPGWEALHFPSLDMENALSASSTLASVPPLGEDNVKRWLNYWKSIGFL